MVSLPRDSSPSLAWRFACIGALASLPATAVLNWLPNSQATIGGGVMIVGALIAGGIAATRSTDSGATGLRTGLLGGIVSILTLIIMVDTSAAWTLSRIVSGSSPGSSSSVLPPSSV